jgi:hypothetical protein
MITEQELVNRDHRLLERERSPISELRERVVPDTKLVIGGESKLVADHLDVNLRSQRGNASEWSKFLTSEIFCSG